MCNLNTDVLSIIFEEFILNYNTLFSCLLVNKCWYETVIPTLWRNPWRNQMKKRQKRSLFETITSFLSEDSKRFLESQGIELVYRIPSFNYITFCTSMINYNLYDIIQNQPLTDDYDRYIVLDEIYRLLIRKCLPLKYMDMSFMQYQFYLLPGAKHWLSDISTLCCSAVTEPYYFQGSAPLCQSIEELCINSCHQDNYGLAKLIEVQKNLKYLEISRNEGNGIDSLDVISRRLNHHARSIIKFKAVFEGILISPKVLPELVNLRELELSVINLILSTKENESEDRMILSEILKEYAPACLNNIT
ncbi:5346_t:CDS:2 [Funneliformis geosporum]|nr:5346_t:CDS:2 [Funneliformis geosporum]